MKQNKKKGDVIGATGCNAVVVTDDTPSMPDEEK
jgi:hypothetical protein